MLGWADYRLIGVARGTPSRPRERAGDVVDAADVARATSFAAPRFDQAIQADAVEPGVRLQLRPGPLFSLTSGVARRLAAVYLSSEQHP